MRVGERPAVGMKAPDERMLETQPVKWSHRRLLVSILLAASLLVPALILRAACVGKACLGPEQTSGEVPFCSLNPDLRRLIETGFYEGRSPNVLAVTGSTAVVGGTGPDASSRDPWPSARSEESRRIPLVLAGARVVPGGSPPAGIGLEDVAPTVAELIELGRPHPRVRSGETIPGIVRGGALPRLVVEVVWAEVGTEELEADPGAWPSLRSLRRDGAGTMNAAIPSLPLDPAAALTTLGTGGTPAEHGIVGTVVLNEKGQVAPAWGRGAPFSVIATLPEHLDELRGQEPRIGVVGAEPYDPRVVGGNWYPESDRDDVALVPGPPARQVEAASRLLALGYGADEVPDVLAVVMRGSVRAMDVALGRLVKEARRVSGGRLAVVVTATGSANRGRPRVAAGWIERRVEERLGVDLIEASTAGGFFLDQDALTKQDASDDQIIDALRELRARDGRLLFSNVFPAFAVTLGRYC